MSTTRTRKTTAAKPAKTTTPKRTPRKTTAKATATVPALPTRTPKPPTSRDFITDTQIRAAYTAALAGVTCTRITGWQTQADGTALYEMPSGAALTYQPTTGALTAWTPCATGIHHPHPVQTPADLRQAQHAAITCPGHQPPATASPEPTDTLPAVRTLADALTHSQTSNEDTQATDVRALRDQPQEHPHG